jgi:thiamine-monophosphate kinase
LLQRFGENSSRELALSGGDDYELCFTVPPQTLAAVQADLAQLGCAATRIGSIVEGDGVVLRGRDGNPLSPARQGWDHFAA